jgi:putative endonuclease
MYFLYLLKCSDGSLYCGITTDVERRFGEHKAGKGGNYTRSHKVLKVVYTEKCKDRSTALKREAAIKKLSRQEKIKLIKEKSGR